LLLHVIPSIQTYSSIKKRKKNLAQQIRKLTKQTEKKKKTKSKIKTENQALGKKVPIASALSKLRRS